MLFKIIGAFIAVVAFCIMIELPKKYMVQAGMTGMVGWAVYLLMEMVASRVEIAALVSALCIATMSHILARVLKAPVSNFLIPGILPIVPGGSIYRCAYAFIRESSYLSTYMNEALKIAGSIALAIFFVDSVFKLHLPKRFKRSKQI
ncbi:MAG: threonine/serine exporter family protein [Lachnoanaerobaculum gingivalis]